MPERRLVKTKPKKTGKTKRSYKPDDEQELPYFEEFKSIPGLESAKSGDYNDLLDAFLYYGLQAIYQDPDEVKQKYAEYMANQSLDFLGSTKQAQVEKAGLKAITKAANKWAADGYRKRNLLSYLKYQEVNQARLMTEYDIYRNVDEMVEDDQHNYVCQNLKCRSTKIRYKHVQLRRADEPPSIVGKCMTCSRPFYLPG